MDLPDAHAALLAAMMELDLIVRPEEIEAGRRILLRAARATGQGLADWGKAIGEHQNLTHATEAFLAQPLETRARLVEDLWEMARADGEIHPDERDFIAKLADLMDVPAQS